CARSLTTTFSRIRPVDLPGFVVAELFGALIGLALMGWLLRPETVQQSSH
ncbi:aquaporin family protein, partial [Mesorhizobium sp. M00.F.Ca.ET.149.01.1.1]